MNLHFLGTASGSPSKERNVSSIALNLMKHISEVWLFDCGEATQHQILHTNIRPSKVRRVFITHLHGDHIFGLLGFLCCRSILISAEPTPLTLYGPKGLRQFVETGLQISQSYLTYPLEIVELDDEGMALDAPDFRVEYRTLSHGVQSYGYKIVEADRTGSLKVDKLMELGVPQGPMYAALKRGETVTLNNGMVLNGNDFIAPPRQGRQVVILGDTVFKPEFADFCHGADVLVHESTFGSMDTENAQQFGHSTCTQAAELAKLAQVKRLILTHISAKYSGEKALTLLTDAQNIFPNTELAYDFFNTKI